MDGGLVVGVGGGSGGGPLQSYRRPLDNNFDKSVDGVRRVIELLERRRDFVCEEL